jgi:hypothetical protein
MRTDGRTDGQTDLTTLIVAFRNFANAPKKRNDIIQTDGKYELYLFVHYPFKV